MASFYSNKSSKLKNLTTLWALLVFSLLGSLAADQIITEKVEHVFSQQNIDAFCLNGEVTKPQPSKEQPKLISFGSNFSSNSLDKDFVKDQRTLFLKLLKRTEALNPSTLHSKNLKTYTPSRAPPVLS